jgi:nuclear GTP-binding protein
MEILDARDPMGCRSKLIESKLLAHNKKLIIILNKIDLVPFQNAQQWQRILKREFPTLLFKANLQNQTHKLSNIQLHPNSMLLLLIWNL